MNTPEKNYLQAMRDSSVLFGMNNAFIEGLYEDYLADASSVPAAWKTWFDSLQTVPGPGREIAHGPVRRAFAALPHADGGGPRTHEAGMDHKQAAVLQLIDAYRLLGVRIADLDPLKRYPPPDVPELDPACYGLTDADMDTSFDTGAQRMALREILQLLRRSYCGSIGAEYMYIGEMEQKRWIQNRLEGAFGTAGYDAALRRRILERLTAAETLERYLHTRYVGQKRFSLEGGETLIPLLDHLLQHAGGQGVRETVIGMAHRGRLNVLVNILGKPPKMLFAEFEGVPAKQLTAGDVKYHQGFHADVAIKASLSPTLMEQLAIRLSPQAGKSLVISRSAGEGANESLRESPVDGSMHVVLAFNPSHLEIVDPVVEGSVRARQHRLGDTDGTKVLPVLIHGDAAFSGQGVVMETLAMSQTRGYRTGGTLHIVVDNQIGYTSSDPRDMRSSAHCSDVAKMVDAPVFHVNADDPEAALLITEIALDYRMKYRKDVVIDLVCYRKLGHNEQDEPLVTQPLMYRLVRRHPGTRALYAQRLEEAGAITKGEAEAMIVRYRKAVSEGDDSILPAPAPARSQSTADWARFAQDTAWDVAVDTAVPLERLQSLAQRLTAVPPGFALHARVQKVIEDRAAMGRGEQPLDWGMAENLAYATLLTEGYPVRLSGQDSPRGTFFHRQAVWHDQNRTERHAGTYAPLQHLAPDQADFTAIDSLLSEEAVLGFEYGYASADPTTLVLWEAQFGDFANGAQVVIDQFIAAGEAKWGRLCGLVLLLPHGYEGQGAEHSSGRIERFLQLCAEYNIQVCVPSTAAQIFHLLRRQMLRPLRKPLIVFTPKSLLRSKDAASPLAEFTRGNFRPVLPETGELDPRKVCRIIACSGKVYYELLAARRAKGITHMAIIRVEQLYPFPHDDFAAQIAAYPNAVEVVWCQEEPGNQGAWHRIQHYLQRHLRPEMKLDYALRPSAAAPAPGYLALHNEQQKDVIEAAFRPDLDIKVISGSMHHER